MKHLSAEERARQNPNNDAYWQARGFKKKPKDWRARKIKIKAEERKRAAQVKAEAEPHTQPEADDDTWWEARGWLPPSRS